ncbi:MAG: radical SAM protein [Leptospiraceae bacterium]|nr:radical SAM protein [Leptospiraceae bacterium]MDW7976648.1 radical SAM protein [Leptospiraceae bacterium]
MYIYPPYYQGVYNNSYVPNYVRFYETRRSEFLERLQLLDEILKNCEVCPHECHVDRNQTFGYCRIGKKVRVSSYFPHFGEEDCLRGWRGSGTIFFTLCNLRCVFCQNYDISQNLDPHSMELEPEQLANIMIYLQEKGVHNINLVSPDHVVPQIIHALYIAIQKGLRIPIVYNSNAYSSLQTLKIIDGLIDIYMPDFKFWDSFLAKRYTKSEDYPDVAKEAIKEMYRQVGDFEQDEYGIAKKGLIVRHLVMPGMVEDSKKILEFLSSISKKIYLNIMSQYRPSNKVIQKPDQYKEINRRITIHEYRQVVEYAHALGFEIIDADL